MVETAERADTVEQTFMLYENYPTVSGVHHKTLDLKLIQNMMKMLRL